MGEAANEKKPVSEDEVEAAMKPVSSLMPKARKATHAVHVDPRRVPTEAELLDPARPDMSQADRGDVMDSIDRIVEDLYKEVLDKKRDEVKIELAKKPSPQGSSLASKLIEMAVEAVVSSAFGAISTFALARLYGGSGHGHEAAGEGSSEGAMEVGKGAGKHAAEYASDRARPDVERTDDPELQLYVSPKHDLLEEYFERIRLRLVVKRHDAIDLLRQLRASALADRAELAGLNTRLRDLIADPRFISWYTHKLTVEWMNFTARLSLGEREAGQHTDLRGANTIGGLYEGGVKAVKAWRGAHDGFIDITLNTSGKGVATFSRAAVVGGPGAAKILTGVGNDADTHGVPYTLATLPVYRRIWLVAGESSLATNPAFVITPEGAIEANLDDPVLANLGGGPDVTADDALRWGGEAYDETSRRDPIQRFSRTGRATQAMAGARAVLALLADQKSVVLK